MPIDVLADLDAALERLKDAEQQDVTEQEQIASNIFRDALSGLKTALESETAEEVGRQITGLEAESRVREFTEKHINQNVEAFREKIGLNALDKHNLNIVKEAQKRIEKGQGSFIGKEGLAIAGVQSLRGLTTRPAMLLTALPEFAGEIATEGGIALAKDLGLVPDIAPITPENIERISKGKGPKRPPRLASSEATVRIIKGLIQPIAPAYESIDAYVEAAITDDPVEKQRLLLRGIEKATEQAEIATEAPEAPAVAISVLRTGARIARGVPEAASEFRRKREQVEVGLDKAAVEGSIGSLEAYIGRKAAQKAKAEEASQLREITEEAAIKTAEDVQKTVVAAEDAAKATGIQQEFVFQAAMDEVHKVVDKGGDAKINQVRALQSTETMSKEAQAEAMQDARVNTRPTTETVDNIVGTEQNQVLQKIVDRRSGETVIDKSEPIRPYINDLHGMLELSRMDLKEFMAETGKIVGKKGDLGELSPSDLAIGWTQIMSDRIRQLAPDIPFDEMRVVIGEIARRSGGRVSREFTRDINMNLIRRGISRRRTAQQFLDAIRDEGVPELVRRLEEGRTPPPGGRWISAVDPDLPWMPNMPEFVPGFKWINRRPEKWSEMSKMYTDMFRDIQDKIVADEITWTDRLNTLENLARVELKNRGLTRNLESVADSLMAVAEGKPRPADRFVLDSNLGRDLTNDIIKGIREIYDFTAALQELPQRGFDRKNYVSSSIAEPFRDKFTRNVITQVAERLPLKERKIFNAHEKLRTDALDALGIRERNIFEATRVHLKTVIRAKWANTGIEIAENFIAPELAKAGNIPGTELAALRQLIARNRGDMFLTDRVTDFIANETLGRFINGIGEQYRRLLRNDTPPEMKGIQKRGLKFRRLASKGRGMWANVTYRANLGFNVRSFLRNMFGFSNEAIIAGPGRTIKAFGKELISDIRDVELFFRDKLRIDGKKTLIPDVLGQRGQRARRAAIAENERAFISEELNTGRRSRVELHEMTLMSRIFGIPLRIFSRIWDTSMVGFWIGERLLRGTSAILAIEDAARVGMDFRNAYFHTIRKARSVPGQAQLIADPVVWEARRRSRNANPSYGINDLSPYLQNPGVRLFYQFASWPSHHLGLAWDLLTKSMKGDIVSGMPPSRMRFLRALVLLGVMNGYTREEFELLTGVSLREIGDIRTELERVAPVGIKRDPIRQKWELVFPYIQNSPIARALSTVLNLQEQYRGTWHPDPVIAQRAKDRARIHAHDLFRQIVPAGRFAWDLVALNEARQRTKGPGLPVLDFQGRIVGRASTERVIAALLGFRGVRPETESQFRREMEEAIGGERQTKLRTMLLGREDFQKRLENLQKIVAAYRRQLVGDVGMSQKAAMAAYVKVLRPVVNRFILTKDPQDLADLQDLAIFGSVEDLGIDPSKAYRRVVGGLKAEIRKKLEQRIIDLIREGRAVPNDIFEGLTLEEMLRGQTQEIVEPEEPESLLEPLPVLR